MINFPLSINYADHSSKNISANVFTEIKFNYPLYKIKEFYP